MAVKLTAGCIIVLLATHGACQGSDCQFHFHLQPRAELNCNPYHQDRAATVLHITCLAIGPVHSELEVEWWYNNSNLTAPERVDLGTHRVIETETTRQSELLVSSAISFTVTGESNEGEEAAGSLCVWCQIRAPGRSLLSPTSNHLCVRGPEAYSDTRLCSLQEVVDHDFGTECVTAMSVSHFHTLGRVWPTPSTRLEDEIVHTPTDTPSAYIRPSVASPSSTEYTASSSIPPGLLPSPTEGTTSEDQMLMLSSKSLTALYTAVAVCVLLAAVVLLLMMVVLIMCRRHSKLRRRRRREEKSSLHPSSELGLSSASRAFHNRSQLLLSGTNGSVAGELLKGGQCDLPFSQPHDIGHVSEQAVRGSIDTRSSCGSREASLSTEKSNSLSRKNSLHKYTEIDTISHSESVHSKTSHSLHASHGDGIHQLSTNTAASGNGSFPGGADSSSKVIPPPPNTRGRSNSTPHYYYILEKLESEDPEKATGKRLKSPWELGTQQREEQSGPREAGKSKDRSDSLKREAGGGGEGGGGGGGEGGGESELFWGEGSMRSRSESCPNRDCKGGGSLKKKTISREGSSKSSKSSSRPGSGKKGASGSSKIRSGTTNGGSGGGGGGSRDGSVKSRGSRDGSFKKEVWVPCRNQQIADEISRSWMQRGPPPHKDYDVLEPKYASQPPLFSIINESYSFRFGQEGDGTGLLFDDPKYAAVSVGDLPQLVSKSLKRYPSLDPIVPRQKVVDQNQVSSQSPPQHRAPVVGGMSKMKAASSKSLQDSSNGGGSGMRRSIYQTRDSTPVGDIVMRIDGGGDTPSRLSMPAFDAY